MVRVAIDVHEVGRWEEVGRELGGLINDVMVTVLDEWVVVRVEELLLGML